MITVVALIVALAAWLFPHAPSAPVATPAPSDARISASTNPGADLPSAALESTSASPTDAAMAYAQQEMTLGSCGTVPIDLDEPRVLPTTGADITYRCIDRRFALSPDVVGGYVDSVLPRTRNTCKSAIRSSAFKDQSRKVAAGLIFCIETPDAAGVPGKIVFVEIINDAYLEPVNMTVSAWHR